MCRIMTTLIVLSILASRAPAAETRPPVRDGAKLFSDRAVSHAIDQLLELRQSFDLDIVFDTTDTLPREAIDRLEHLGNSHRTFNAIAAERAAEVGIRGLY